MKVCCIYVILPCIDGRYFADERVEAVVWMSFFVFLVLFTWVAAIHILSIFGCWASPSTMRSNVM